MHIVIFTTVSHCILVVDIIVFVVDAILLVVVTVKFVVVVAIDFVTLTSPLTILVVATKGAVRYGYTRNCRRCCLLLRGLFINLEHFLPMLTNIDNDLRL